MIHLESLLVASKTPITTTTNNNNIDNNYVAKMKQTSLKVAILTSLWGNKMDLSLWPTQLIHKKKEIDNNNSNNDQQAGTVSYGNYLSSILCIIYYIILYTILYNYIYYAILYNYTIYYIIYYTILYNYII